MVGAMPVVKQGGTIIIAAECAEGIGSPLFTRTLLEAGNLEQFVAHISQPDVFLPEEWQVEELAKVARKAEIYCVAGGIPAARLGECFVHPSANIEAALKAAFARHGQNATVLAIPRGPYVIPYIG